MTKNSMASYVSGYRGCREHSVNVALGITFESSGSWFKYIQLIISKAWQRIHIMQKLKFHLERKSLDIIYTSFIRPILEYADVVLCNLTKYQEDELEKKLKLPG